MESAKSGGFRRVYHPLPTSSEQWHSEIALAFQEAREIRAYAGGMGTYLPEAGLFHLAPYLCLAYRGLNLSDQERGELVTSALALSAAHMPPGEEGSKPERAFARCYWAALVILDLISEDESGLLEAPLKERGTVSRERMPDAVGE